MAIRLTLVWRIKDQPKSIILPSLTKRILTEFAENEKEPNLVQHQLGCIQHRLAYLGLQIVLTLSKEYTTIWLNKPYALNITLIATKKHKVRSDDNEWHNTRSESFWIDCVAASWRIIVTRSSSLEEDSEPSSSSSSSSTSPPTSFSESSSAMEPRLGRTDFCINIQNHIRPRLQEVISISIRSLIPLKQWNHWCLTICHFCQISIPINVKSWSNYLNLHSSICRSAWTCLWGHLRNGLSQVFLVCIILTNTRVLVCGSILRHKTLEQPQSSWIP